MDGAVRNCDGSILFWPSNHVFAFAQHAYHAANLVHCCSLAVLRYGSFFSVVLVVYIYKSAVEHLLCCEKQEALFEESGKKSKNHHTCSSLKL